MKKEFNSKDIKPVPHVAANAKPPVLKSDTEKDPDDEVHLQQPNQSFKEDEEIDMDDLVHQQDILPDENEEKDLDDLVHRKYKKE